VDAVDNAFKSMESWPEFKYTRLVSLPWLAHKCGVKAVLAKDESDRCGLTSFKALGGGLVVDDVVRSALSEGKPASSITVATASAGNHGMGVAWGSKRHGCQAVIYLAQGVSESIAQKMRNFGAKVSRVQGVYEDALRAAKDDCERNGWTLVQDVSWDGYNSIPARIHSGYGVVAREILEQMLDEPPTHVLVNAGVGGFACAICGYLWDKLGAVRPRFICVEPTAADCLQHASRTGGNLVLPAGDESTVQVGLDCREVSPLAWRVLATGVNDFVAVPDAAVGPCMKLLAENVQPLVAGESGVAGIAVLLAAAVNSDLKEQLKLDADSRVAVIMCEAPPSAESYEALVGVTPDEVVKRTYAQAFVPMKDSTQQDWTGTLLDLFSPDDKNPNSRRFIDLDADTGELQVSADTGKEKWGRRFNKETYVNPVLSATSKPHVRKTSFLSKVPTFSPLYAQAKAGALDFTLVLGTVFGKKVIKWNGLYNGRGGKFDGKDVPPCDFDNFWEFLDK
jgi:diaminopropionate ammonia-lyase